MNKFKVKRSIWQLKNRCFLFFLSFLLLLSKSKPAVETTVLLAIFNRPGIAGAVLQTPSSLIRRLTDAL